MAVSLTQWGLSKSEDLKIRQVKNLRMITSLNYKNLQYYPLQSYKSNWRIVQQLHHHPYSNKKQLKPVTYIEEWTPDMLGVVHSLLDVFIQLMKMKRKIRKHLQSYGKMNMLSTQIKGTISKWQITVKPSKTIIRVRKHWNINQRYRESMSRGLLKLIRRTMLQVTRQ